MAKAQSLEKLRAAVQRDLSNQVHVSHGLFRSPYPFGAHLVCEVDTRSLPEVKWGNTSAEFVLRLVPLGDGDPTTSGRLQSITKMLNTLHPGVTISPASFQALMLALRTFKCCPAGLKDQETVEDDLEKRIDQLCIGSSHPNIVPLIGAFLGQEIIFLVFPPAPYTLKSILHFSPTALGDDWQLRLLLYQIIACLDHCHGSGIFHGNLNPSNVLVTSSMWCRITGFGSSSKKQASAAEGVDPTEVVLKDSDSELEWRSQFRKWCRGELSNFDYLLLLNRLAGRRWGDRCFHTVIPWVIDFTVKPEEEKDAGWRDLTKSKWRLAKGDEQLDFTYATADIPHHVSDECLSELAVCIYKARRLPLLVLRRVVRSVYEPNEYPGTMQRLYHWTPDECIPEFYNDPDVFRSLHKGMGNLAVPAWANDPEEFVSLHRAALESDRVSKQLHHWIDLTFGYKLSGESAVSAKNVTLSTTAVGVPKSSGRRQLFDRPHPARHVRSSEAILSLELLQESASFSESARFLSPWYGYSVRQDQSDVGTADVQSASGNASRAILRNVLETDQKLWDDVFKRFQLEQDDDEEYFHQSFAAWKAEVSSSKQARESESADVFAVGCLIAEIYLQKPLFDLTTAAIWSSTGTLPGIINQLPPHIRVLVEATLSADFKRRPTAKQLLDSPFFPQAVRSAYTFLSSFQFLTNKQDRLHYVAKMAQRSAFLRMGPATTKLCAPPCLSVFRSPYQDFDPMSVTILLKSLLQVLGQKASRRLLVPLLESILQDNEAVELKVALLRSSFMKNLRRIVGTTVYLQHIHGLVVLNVLRSGEGPLGVAASVVLVDTCQELGLPISFHQTILPLLQSLGRDITAHGIDTVVDIGERFGEQAIVKHWLPPLRYVLMLGIEPSSEKTGPVHSWRLLAAVDAMVALDRLVPTLSPVGVLQELLQEPNNVFLKILQQKNLPHAFLENAARALLSACNQMGPELTFLHLMSQLKQLFDELAYRNEEVGSSAEVGFLVSLLYPGFASLLGVEKLRQSLPCWLVLEQGLARKFDWKWKDEKMTRACSSQNLLLPEDSLDVPRSLSPANLLLNGVGWSVPQSQAAKWTSALNGSQGIDAVEKPRSILESTEEPWFWLPAFDETLSGSESGSANRIGAAHAITKDEQSWKLNAVVAHSWRAHTGTMRASRLGNDESVIFTAGGVRGKSIVRKWDFSTTKCIMEYSGHEEVVNNICVLQGYERVASCDGTLHIWNSETGKRLASLDETSGMISFEGRRNAPTSEAVDGTLSTGILSGGNVYTVMHIMDSERRLVVGTASGYLRFVDVVEGRLLYAWRCEPSDKSFSSFISSVTSASSLETFESNSTRPSWIAVGFSSGHCSLLDFRSGSVIGHWRAHGAEITNLAALDENYLVSSSLDRTISIWDLRRGWPLQPQTFQGHTDGVTSFALWGSNILSAAGSKIGVSSFSKLLHQDQSKQMINPRKIYTSDRSSRNLSIINTISVLPFSRQFVIGTEDGHLKVCV